MKTGVEAEGRLRGVPTLFCSAEEIGQAQDWIRKNHIGHVYISDLDNILISSKGEEVYEFLRLAFSKKLVTLETTLVIPSRRHTLAVNILLRVTAANVEAIPSLLPLLAPLDQVKFSCGQHVWVFPVHSAMRAFPCDFTQDLEV